MKHSKTDSDVNSQFIIDKLEIWGKAQRESARRPKSDWGKRGWGVKFSRHQSHVATQMHCHSVSNVKVTQVHWHTPNAHCRLRVSQHERL